MKLIAGRARCRLSSSAALVDELQQFGGAGRTGEGLDFIALANRSIDRPRNYQPISALWGAWTRRPLGQVGGARAGSARAKPRVEVAGIEPASFVASTGLLRAQCALSLLDPTGLTHEPV